jgi:predicted O-methyltransferase YrrM
MTTYGREHSFPIVGPAVGRFLRVAATMVDAERIFEFGSGFGYSAVWFAGALPETGEIVLTDYDGDNLDRAREFMRDAGYDELATYRAGDAVQSFEATDGDFDVVLIDHEKERYTDAFERAADELADGGVVIADNVMDGPVEPADVAAVLDGADPTDATTAGIVDYVETVRDDPRFETSLVPLGQGIAVSVER